LEIPDKLFDISRQGTAKSIILGNHIQPTVSGQPSGVNDSIDVDTYPSAS